MTVVRKFLFENDFDASARRLAGARQGANASGAAKPGEPSATPNRSAGVSESEIAAAIDAARREGEQAGLAKGRAEAIAGTERQIGQAMAMLANGFAALAKSTEQFGAAAAQAIELGLAIARKLHPALAARNGLSDVEALLVECLESLKKEPRLVAYVCPDNLDAMRQRLDQLSAKAGYEGRVVLIGDEAMSGADCRVEWADGGIERNARQTWREMEAALDRYLSMGSENGSATGDENGR